MKEDLVLKYGGMEITLYSGGDESYIKWDHLPEGRDFHSTYSLGGCLNNIIDLASRAASTPEEFEICMSDIRLLYSTLLVDKIALKALADKIFAERPEAEE